MRYTPKVFMALLLVTALGIGACQQTKTPKPSPTESSTPQASEAKTDSTKLKPAVDEWIEFKYTEWIPVVDQLGQHLHQAHQSFVKKDNQKAAAEIRKGATFLKQERERASLEGQANIDEAVEDLNAFATLVEDGKIKSVKELNPVFAQAYQADIEHLWVTVAEDEWIPIIEKPEYYWRSAHDLFVEGDNPGSAKEIHKGVAFLKLRSHQFQGEDKQALTESASTLKELADQVKKGAIKDVAVLDKAFAKEYLMQTKADISQANKDILAQKTKPIGYALKAAAHNLESAASWTKKESTVQGTVSKTREVAEQFIAGDKKDAQPAKDTIKSLEEANQTLTQELN